MNSCSQKRSSLIWMVPIASVTIGRLALLSYRTGPLSKAPLWDQSSNYMRGAFFEDKNGETLVSPDISCLPYQHMLTTTVVVCWYRFGGPGAIFIQNNALIKTARSAMAWFQGQKTPYFAMGSIFPVSHTRSTSCGGLLPHIGCPNGRQFQTPGDLKRRNEIS
jgi:hypothetical protein